MISVLCIAGSRATEETLPGFNARLERLLPWDLDLGPLGSPERTEIIKDIRNIYFGGQDRNPTLFQYYEVGLT